MPTPAINPDGPFLAAGDVDGDDDVDFVTGVTYVENDTANTTGAPDSSIYGVLTSFPFGSPCLVIDPFISPLTDGVLADLNGDGLPELIAGSSVNGSIGIWTNAVGVCSKRRFVDARSPAGGSCTFTMAAPGFQSLVVGDFDGDGDNDIVWGGTAGGLTFINNAATTTPGRRDYITAAVTVPGATVETLAAADFDGDGDLDLAIGGGTLLAPTHELVLNSGLGKFVAAPGAVPPVAGFPLSVTAADVDEDGDSDIVYGHFAFITAAGGIAGGGLAILANGGMGVFAAPQIISLGVSFTGIAVGDVDEDGLVDILGGTRLEEGTVAGVNIRTTNGTRMFSRPAAGALYADLSLARIGSDPAIRPFACPEPLNPLADAIDPASCLPLDATGIVLADFDLDLDLDIQLCYRLADRLGVFTNLLWQLETPRESFVQPSSTMPGMWEWNVPYDMYCEFNVPNFGGTGGLGVAAVSLTPPIHLFPATTLGVLTSAPYVTGPTTGLPGGQGQFNMTLGPFSTPTMLSLVGTRLYATAGVISFGRGVLRLAKVAETTLR